MKCITTKEYDCLLCWAPYNESMCAEQCSHPYFEGLSGDDINNASDDAGDDREVCNALVSRGLMYLYICPHIKDNEHLFLTPRGKLAMQIYRLCQNGVEL